MKNWMLLAPLALGLIVAPVSAAELNAGDEAPAFNLPGSDGKTYDLADFKDKQVVVVAWFPRAFTSGCTAECKSMRADGELIRAYNVAYFTASCDDPKKNADFAKSLDLDFPILIDPGKKVAEAYGVVNESRPNPLRWTFYIGADGKILHVDRAVKTGSHGKDIAAKLGELGVAKK